MSTENFSLPSGTMSTEGSFKDNRTIKPGRARGHLVSRRCCASENTATFEEREMLKFQAEVRLPCEFDLPVQRPSTPGTRTQPSTFDCPPRTRTRPALNRKRATSWRGGRRSVTLLRAGSRQAALLLSRGRRRVRPNLVPKTASSGLWFTHWPIWRCKIHVTAPSEYRRCRS